MVMHLRASMSSSPSRAASAAEGASSVTLPSIGQESVQMAVRMPRPSVCAGFLKPPCMDSQSRQVKYMGPRITPAARS